MIAASGQRNTVSRWLSQPYASPKLRRAAWRWMHRGNRCAWRWIVFRLRDLLWRADEWVHAEEIKLRESNR